MRRPLALIPLALLLAGTAGAAGNGPALYEKLAAQTAAGECYAVDIDLAGRDTLAVDAAEAGRPAGYRLHYDDIAEGWSWRDVPAAGETDYYRYKSLPLGSRSEKRGEYQAEDQIGELQTMNVVWRYDYYLAFADPARLAALPDDAGGHFAAPAKTPPEALRVVARVCPDAPPTRESTTFWKATHGTPVDFTLKKRYLVGQLQRIEFVDSRSGEVISAVPAATTP